MPSRYFTDDEMRCKCGCGRVRMNDVFLAKLDQLREMMNEPLVGTSFYRCENHPAERSKDGSTTGAHVQGKAADIAASGVRATRLIAFAHALSFTGIGAKQHGPVAGRFVHVDIVDGTPRQPRPHFWTYP